MEKANRKRVYRRTFFCYTQKRNKNRGVNKGIAE